MFIVSILYHQYRNILNENCTKTFYLLLFFREKRRITKIRRTITNYTTKCSFTINNTLSTFPQHSKVVNKSARGPSERKSNNMSSLMKILKFLVQHVKNIIKKFMM